jgi:hypothetical protein
MPVTIYASEENVNTLVDATPRQPLSSAQPHIEQQISEGREPRSVYLIPEDRESR